MVKPRGVWTSNIDEMSKSTFYRLKNAGFFTLDLKKNLKRTNENQTLSSSSSKYNNSNQEIINIDNSSSKEVETLEVVVDEDKMAKSSMKISQDLQSNEIEKLKSEIKILNEQNDNLQNKLADSHHISNEMNKLKISFKKLNDEYEQLKSERKNNNFSEDCSSENLIAIACTIFNRIGKISDLNKLHLFKEYQEKSDKNNQVVDENEFEEEMVPYTDNPNFAIYTLPISVKYMFEKYNVLKKGDKLVYTDTMLIRKILNTAMSKDEWKSNNFESIMKNQPKLLNAIKLFVQTLRPKIDNETWINCIRTKINDAKKDSSNKPTKKKAN